MSDDLSELEAPVAMGPQVETSRLAIFSVLSGVICIPGLSGLLGISLGLMALRQIARSQYLVGANLAWMGILSGITNAVVWGSVGSRYLSVRERTDATVSQFMTAWSKSEADGESAAGPGLSPFMHRGRADELRTEMLKRLGPFRGLGDRVSYAWRVKHEGIAVHDEATVVYPLTYETGAPAEGEFELGFTGSDLRVIGYRITSPVLSDLERQKANEAHGMAAPEIADFGSGNGKPDPKQMRSFNKHQ